MNKTKCALLLLGPPGSGKTTLARSLAARTNLSVLETGNLLEKQVRDKTPLGQQISSFKAAGELVPSEIVKQVLSDALKKAEGELILFDGFPRSLGQVDMFFQLLQEHQLDFCAAIALKVDLQTSTTRLAARRICSQCGAITNVPAAATGETIRCQRCGAPILPRPDDRPEIMANRFAVYERETLPVLELFKRDFPHLTWEEIATTTPEDLAQRVHQRLQQSISK